jgi:hypothetical protein
MSNSHLASFLQWGSPPNSIIVRTDSRQLRYSQ